jgi:two-component system cell cycle sensor histidine kinase/response regulator CckA
MTGRRFSQTLLPKSMHLNNGVIAPLRLLLLEDRTADADLLMSELRSSGVQAEVKVVGTRAAYLKNLDSAFDAIISDFDLPQFNAKEALALLQAQQLDIPFIVVSGATGEETAVDLMKLGAADYLLKDRLARLPQALAHAIEARLLRAERLAVQKELRESEERVRAVIDSALDCIITIDHESRILEFNPAAEKIFGRWRVQAVGRSFAEIIIPPRFREEDGRGLAAHLKTGNAKILGQRLEITAMRADGSEFPVELTVNRIGTREPPLFTAFLRDITEQKSAEEKLWRQEKQYRQLFEENPSPMWVYNNKTLQILAVNEAASAQYGYSRSEFLKLNLKDLRPSEDVPDLIKARDLPASRSTPHFSGQFRHVRKDGSLLLVEIYSGAIVWAGVAAHIVSALDVSERKRAEDRLREQAKLLDLAQDAIMVRDMEDRVEFWNHGAEKLYGWTAAEVQGKEASGFLYKDEPAAAARAAVIENGKWTGVCKHTCKDGGTVMVCSRWTLVRDELAAPKSILIINTDITEQKKIEEQFLRAQRLESIGTLASGVAHDLNNILVPILMAAPLLRGDVPEEEREKFLAIVEQSAQRGASIVKQVLTFARGADGDRILLQPIYLVEEIAKIVQETFPKSVTVRTNYPEDLRTLVADPTQLHQILLNLCINARDAMPNGGSLKLILENFEVDDHYASMTPGAKAGPHVLLEVSDTGTGIPRETIDKIFDPFFTTKELGEGTGLGLSTVIGIVKSHGGFMEVDSEMGRGTSFKVFLPANMSELEAAQTSEAAPLPPANGELLLIVDDEKAILQVAKAILEDHGYRVLTAADATEALAIFALRMNEIELVLTDLAMPFMDGVALIRTLQKMKPDVRVIASTGRGGQDARANEIAHLNVRASLTKPYNKNKLLATLHDVLTQAPDNQ